jgi:PEP-CTERM/exosortase A-associated glycosyltransferase
VLIRRVWDRVLGALLLHVPVRRLPSPLSRLRRRAAVRRSVLEVAAAEQLRRSGRHADALAALDQAAARCPESAAPQIALAFEHHRHGDLAAARRRLSAALALDAAGTPLDRFLTLAVDLQHGEAITALQSAARADPERAGAFAERAVAAAEVAALMTADPTVEAIDRTMAMSPWHARWTVRWAVTDDDLELLRHLAATREPAEFDVSSARALAMALRRGGDLTVSARLAERVLSDVPDDGAVRRLVEIGHAALALRHTGWTAPPRAAATSYEPRERSACYLLQNSLPFATAGYATRTHGLLTALTRLGWDVHAVTKLGYPYDGWEPDDPRRPAAADLIDGVPYHRLNDGPGRYLKWPLDPYIEDYAGRVAALAAQHRAGVIHAASNYRNGFAAITAAHRLGLPAVYEVRGLWELTRTSRQSGFEASEMFHLTAQLEAAACQQADHVLAITAAVRADLIARGISEKRVSVLPNGVDSARFRPRPRDEELAAQLGMAGRVVIGYVGSILDYEGIDTLLHAVAALRRSHPDFRVLIVGAGDAHAACLELRDELGLAETVTFTGRVPHDEVERYYSVIDIAPFARKPLPVCEMVSPLKPFEAMAMGKVPVVSSVAALAEIVDDGRTGLVFDKGDATSLAAALVRLLDDDALRTRLGLQAREWVVRHRDWSAVVQTLDELYAELTARSSTTGTAGAPAPA